mgnify:CR=1 FL=1
MAKISIAAFEQKVFELEEMRVVVRGNPNNLVEDYDYDRATNSRTSITKWLENRVKPCVGDHRVVVIAGEGTIPNGLTHVSKLRKSYVE